MKLRVGLVGMGQDWETRHAPAFRALSDRFQITAICSGVALRAERIAAEFNSVAVDGFRALARREDVDAVMILSPEWYGSLPILAACESSKAIYCAPAFEMGLEEARRVKCRVEEAGVAFMAEFPRRHAAATLRLKELIATRLGNPQYVFCHLRKAVPETHEGNKKSAVRIANRALFELVDWCRYVVSEPVTSVTSVRKTKGDFYGGHYQTVCLDFSQREHCGSGPLAEISCGHYMPSSWKEAITFRPPAAMQVCCDNGVAFVDLPNSLVWFDDAGRHMESLESERPIGEQMLSLFHRSITSLVRRRNDLEDAYQAIEIVLNAQRSAIEGRRIETELS